MPGVFRAPAGGRWSGDAESADESERSDAGQSADPTLADRCAPIIGDRAAHPGLQPTGERLGVARRAGPRAPRINGNRADSELDGKENGMSDPSSLPTGEESFGVSDDPEQKRERSRIDDLVDRIKESADKLAADGSSRGDMKIVSRTLR